MDEVGANRHPFQKHTRGCILLHSGWRIKHTRGCILLHSGWRIALRIDGLQVTGHATAQLRTPKETRYPAPVNDLRTLGWDGATLNMPLVCGTISIKRLLRTS